MSKLKSARIAAKDISAQTFSEKLKAALSEANIKKPLNYSISTLVSTVLLSKIVLL